MPVEQFAAVALALLACAFDLRSRRIPNMLTFGAAGAAIVFHLLAGGVGAASTAVAGWACGVALFFPFFALRGMGAGDLKLLAALGAWLGPAAALWIALFAAMSGAVLAIVMALTAGYGRQLWRNLTALVALWLTVGFRPLDIVTLEGGRGPRLPYAVPLAIGVIAVCVH